MTAETEAMERPVAAPEIRNLKLNDIEPDPNNSRKQFDEEFLRELAASIREHGVVQPIVVRLRPDTAQGFHFANHRLISGEQRWRASQMAGLETIPAIIRTDLDDGQVLAIQLVENLQRKNLSLSEISHGCASLVKLIGLDDACKRLSMSKPWVSRRAGLVDLDPEIQSLIAEQLLKDVDAAYSLAKIREVHPKAFAGYITKARSGEVQLSRDFLQNELSICELQVETNRQREIERQKKAEQTSTPEVQAEREDRKEKQELQKARTSHANQLRADLQTLTATLTEDLCEVVGVRYEKGGATAQPIRIYPDYPNEFGTADLPKSAEACRFEVMLDGPLQVVSDALNIVAPGCHVKMSLEVPVKEAFRIQQLLGRPLAVNAKTDTKGGKLRKAIDEARGAGKRNSVSQAKQPAAKGAVPSCVAQFIAQGVQRRKGAQTPCADFHAAYVRWCKLNQLEPLSLNDNAWASAIHAAKIEKHRTKHGRLYIGVELR